jgi:hypothetical protein
MKIVHAKTDIGGRKKIVAANVFEDDMDFDGPDLANDTDTVEEDVVEEDMGEDGQQDGSTIEIDNNILLQSV